MFCVQLIYDWHTVIIVDTRYVTVFTQIIAPNNIYGKKTSETYTTHTCTRYARYTHICINWSSNHVKIMENALLLVSASLAYNYMILKVCLPDRKLIACWLIVWLKANQSFPCPGSAWQYCFLFVNEWMVIMSRLGTQYL